MNIGTSKLDIYIKRPDEILPIEIGFGKLHILPRGATKITAATASAKRWKRKFPQNVEGANDFLTSTTPAILTPNETTVRITTTGGLDGYDYVISLRVTFDNNAVLEDEIYVRVKEPIGDINYIADTPSGGFNLDRLDDVTISTPLNNQLLKYNSTTSQWVNYSPSFTYASFTAKDNQPPSLNFATEDSRNSIKVLDFDDSVNESAVFLGIIPQNSYLTGGLKIRLHWLTTSAISGACRWGVSIERCNTDLDSDSFTTNIEQVFTSNATSGIINISEISLTNIDGLLSDELYRLKISRIASHETDTILGDVELVAVEVRGA